MGGERRSDEIEQGPSLFGSCSTFIRVGMRSKLSLLGYSIPPGTRPRLVPQLTLYAICVIIYAICVTLPS